MKLTNNFTLEELTKSSTAQKLGIDNTPNETVKAKLKTLCETILQPIRDKWGAPLIVTSGFRCEKLNKAVGGAVASDHKYGCAADFHTKSDSLADNKKLFEMIKKMIENKEITVKQLIWEYGSCSCGPDWIHVSFQDGRTAKKNQILYIGCK